MKTLRLLCASVLSGFCLKAFALGALTAGIDYPPPEYRAGEKFRTPDAIDAALLQELGQRSRRRFQIVRAAPGGMPPQDGIVLAALAADDLRQRDAAVIPLPYVVEPMAVMRTDTDIKRWEQLKGRKVCLSEGGRYVGLLAARFGAIEKVQRAPADSLLAVRTGACDAAVHDRALLEELLKLPEWKKFSARLVNAPGIAPRQLSLLVPRADTVTADALRKAVAGWKSSGMGYLSEKAAKHIAFEVYLDQDVPDCH